MHFILFGAKENIPKHEKNNALYYFTSCIGRACGFFIFQKPKPTEEQQKDFACKNIDELSKIELKDRNGHEIILSKAENTWLLNNKEKVNAETLKTMLNAIENIYAESPAPNTAVDIVLKSMIGKSTKVSLYKNNSKKPYKVYYVGGPTKDNLGTFMIMEIKGKMAERPYVVKMAGHKGYLTYHYPTTIDDWRSLEFVSYLPNEIKSVAVSFAENPEFSYKLSKENDSFKVETGGKTYMGKQVNEGAAQSIFSSFGHLHFEKYEDKAEKQDSIKTNLHFADFSLEDIYGKTHKLGIYYMPLGNLANISMDSQGNPVKYDVDRLYAFNEETQLMMSVQYYTFGKYFLSGSSLIRPE
ncbi:MAG: DUF4340 domain-containing protein [Chitinophagales bacterium]|nr:DUF4340 domain-containing protein [Chitinophagales bacterium]